ncbi:MAG: glutamate racemase [Armatimonadetes bacterium]|nr:glutamate racemase [Armatimonadota bacterium]
MPGAPIGVFDSGVGGLTVVRELLWRLPHESLLYLADTAHVPYGPRDPDELRGFALGITQWLAEQGCKLVVMACNTSSALALDAARRLVDVPVLGVIEGGVRGAAAVVRDGAVAVLATAATVRSFAYPTALRALRPGLEVHQAACPDFVPLVEAGRLGTPDAYSAVCDYLDQLPLADLDALVLGCTHYPFLAPGIRMKAAEHTHLVDPAVETAKAVKRLLAERGLAGSGPARHRLVATGSTESVERIKATCFGGSLPRPERVEPLTWPACEAR